MLKGESVHVDSRGLLSIWNRIEALPSWAFIGWVTALCVLRSGLSWGGTVTAELEGFARTFPHPGPTFRSNAVIGPTLAWVFNMDTDTRWLLLQAVLAVAWFVLVAVLLHRRLGSGRAWRVAMVWLGFLSLPASLLHHLGDYDVFSAIGATLVALAGTPGLLLSGGAIMGATNVEQGFLAVICGALVAWSLPQDRGAGLSVAEVTRRFVPAAVGLGLARIAVVVWFHVIGADVGSRLAEFPRLLPASLDNAASLGATGVYAWLSAGWVIVVSVVWRIRERELTEHRRPSRWMVAAVGLVVLPALAAVTTTDGTRVFAAVGTVALLMALVSFAESAEDHRQRWILSFSAALMVFGFMVPSIVTTFHAGIRVPWRFALQR